MSTFPGSQDDNVVLTQIRHLFESGRYVEAEELAAQLLARSLGDRQVMAEAQHLLGASKLYRYCEDKRTMSDDARGLLLNTARKILVAVRDSHPEYEGLGWVHQTLGDSYSSLYVDDADWDAAQREYATALVLANQDDSLAAFAHEGLGYVRLIGTDEYDQAVTHYKSALRLLPSEERSNHQAFIHVHLSLAYWAQGAYEQALAAARQALALIDPDTEDYSVLRCRALCAEASSLGQIEGQEDLAIARYQAYWEVCSDERTQAEAAPDHEILGDVYDRKGDYEAAVQQYRKALDVDPENSYRSRIHDRLGRALARLHRSKEALEHFEYVLNAQDEASAQISRPTIYAWMANCYAELKLYTQVVACLERAAQLTPPDAPEYADYLQRLERWRSWGEV